MLVDTMHWILDLVFPIRCLGCGCFDTYLCTHCRPDIPTHIAQECIGCARTVQKGQTCVFCAKEWAVDQLFVATDYKNSLVQKLIKTLKYRFVSDIANYLAPIIMQSLKKAHQSNGTNIFSDNPLIVPVPLTAHRERWRGFNQAQLLAQRIADAHQLSCASNILTRTAHTSPQAEIENRDQRLTNVSSAFVCENLTVSGRTVLLVDDVCTTGATLNACARVLKQKGVAKVIGLVVARG